MLTTKNTLIKIIPLYIFSITSSQLLSQSIMCHKYASILLAPTPHKNDVSIHLLVCYNKLAAVNVKMVAAIL